MGLSINSNRKGKRGERELVDIYKSAGYPAYRTANSGGLYNNETEEMAEATAHLAGDIQGVDRVHIEAKRGKSIRVWEALAQAERDCPAGKIPTAHVRRDNDTWCVFLKLHDFIKLLKS